MPLLPKVLAELGLAQLKLVPSFFSEEGFDEKFKYCFRSSKSSATSYQKIPNQWRVPLIYFHNQKLAEAEVEQL